MIINLCLKLLAGALLLPLFTIPAKAQDNGDTEYVVLPFGERGQIKMTYDARQRPNCIFMDRKVHLAVNAGADVGATGKSKSTPMVVSYDLDQLSFSDFIVLGSKSSDHHDGPVIWADTEEKLHVFCGWHNDLGKHLAAKQPGTVGSQRTDWFTSTPPGGKMAYPWVARIYNNQHMVFYRTDGHYSSWTYRITSDNGISWDGPENDVIDLDQHLGMDTDWSVYTAKEISKDGKFLHVGFIAYDDYKRPRSPEELATGELDKTRQKNPLYDHRRVSYKYNLYYIKIDLRNHKVMNHTGDILETPIDLACANEKCMIWDTQWRGSGIVPSMFVDDNDDVHFLHNISDFQHEDSLDYHYVRFEDGAWKTTRITDSNHEWNSGYLTMDPDENLHAYIITGNGYFHSDGYMDKHGGGDIEEWISSDGGDSWNRSRSISVDPDQFNGWKYNNIQPVRNPDGTTTPGMLLFYGWKHPDDPLSKAFLYLELDVLRNTGTSMKVPLESNRTFTVSPNPASGFLHINFPGNVIHQMKVYDLSGQLLDSQMINSDQALVDIEHLEDGIYLLMAESNKGISTAKILKSKWGSGKKERL